MAVGRELWERHGPFVELDRGADTLFVRRVAEAEGPNRMRFEPEMCDTHLEISSPLAFFRKSWTYGRSYATYSRVRLLRRSVERRGGGACRTLLLAGLLAAGFLTYRLGTLVARWRQVP